MDVNEQIVVEYIKTVENWFYMTDISFKVRGEKGGANYSNIDILAYDHKKDTYYDIEVKYRSAYQIGKNIVGEGKKVFEKLVSQMTRSQRQEKIEEIIGKGKKGKTVKIFVTTKKFFGKTDELEKKFKARLKDEGYKNAVVWYFDELIPKLYHTLEEKGRYNTELTQTIRLIKTYIEPDDTP